MDLFGLDDKDESLLLKRDTSLSGQFARQWKSGMMAKGAYLKEVANS